MYHNNDNRSVKTSDLTNCDFSYLTVTVTLINLSEAVGVREYVYCLLKSKTVLPNINLVFLVIPFIPAITSAYIKEPRSLLSQNS